MLQGLTAPVALKHGGRRRDEPTAGGEEWVTASGEGWGGAARIRARRGSARCARIIFAKRQEKVLSRFSLKYENN